MQRRNKPRSKTQGDIFEQPKKVKEKRNKVPGYSYEFEDGFYEGSLVNNKRQGTGRIITSSGLILYDGEWRNDQYDGYGTKIYIKSGDRHHGQYKNGKRNGCGVYLFANGDKYTGALTIL